MAVRPVVRLPHPVLKEVASPLEVIDGDAADLASDLLDTMHAWSHCVGLAAPQIGVGLRVIVVDVSGHPKGILNHGEIVLFNPEVVASAEPVVAREGCMSVPDLTGDVIRPGSLLVRGITRQGSERTIEAVGLEARALLHEIDHLDGLLFLDRVSSREAVFRRQIYR